MINTPQTRTDRRFRLGASSVIRHVNQKPSGLLAFGNQRLPVEILGAIGSDAHVQGAVNVGVGQRVTLYLTSPQSADEISIRGIVHWVGSGDAADQAGIMLNEEWPADATVRIPGCQRNSIRYACRVNGVMSWIEGGAASSTSTAAIAMNYARDGICFQVAVAPSVETPVKFTWKQQETESQLHGVIRWVIGQDGGFMTGCELMNDRGYKLAGVVG